MTEAQTILNRIVLSELKKLESAAALDFTLTQDQLDRLESLARIVKVSPPEDDASTAPVDIQSALTLVAAVTPKEGM